jgi:hypothetical protein
MPIQFGSMPTYYYKSLFSMSDVTRWRWCLTSKLNLLKVEVRVAVEALRVVRRPGSHIFLDNRLTDGGEVVSLTHRPPFTPRKMPGTHFC